jgi:hypothetical protein
MSWLRMIAVVLLIAGIPAGEAALAMGLRSARRMAGKGAIAANAALLTIGVCGVLAADGPGRVVFDCRRGFLPRKLRRLL